MTDLNTLQRDAGRGDARAQFLLSQEYFRQQELDSMIHWLTLASDQDLPVANEALGFCHEMGRGVPRDPVGAMSLYSRAIEHGAYRAAFRKATLLYNARDAEQQQAPSNRGNRKNSKAGEGHLPVKASSTMKAPRNRLQRAEEKHRRNKEKYL